MIVRSHAMLFAVRRFVLECEGRRVELGLTMKDVENLAEYHAYSHLTFRQADNIEMKNFLKLCNLFDLDPRDFFELKP